MRRDSWRSVARMWRPPGGHHAFAQDDVGAAAGHVGGDGHHALLPGLGHDLRLFFVLLGVQNLVLDALPFQQLAQVFRFFDGDGAHQNRLAPVVAVLDVLHHGLEFFRLGLVDGRRDSPSRIIFLWVGMTMTSRL